MYELTNTLIENFEYQTNIIYHKRFRDDGFIIYNSDCINEIHELFKIANSMHPLLKCTYSISESEIIFLDTTIYMGERFRESTILDIKSYIKPTNITFQYLHIDQVLIWKDLLLGWMYKTIMCNTIFKTILSKQLKFFKGKLIERGYDCTENQNIIDDVMQYDRDETLKSKEKSSSKSPNVIVTKFDPRIRCLKKRLLKHWHLIKSNESLKS